MFKKYCVFSTCRKFCSISESMQELFNRKCVDLFCRELSRLVCSSSSNGASSDWNTTAPSTRYRITMVKMASRVEQRMAAPPLSPNAACFFSGPTSALTGARSQLLQLKHHQPQKAHPVGFTRPVKWTAALSQKKMQQARPEPVSPALDRWRHHEDTKHNSWPHLSARFVCPGLRLFQSLFGPALMIESLDPYPLGNPSPSDSKGGDTGQKHTRGLLYPTRSKFNPMMTQCLPRLSMWIFRRRSSETGR